MKTPVSTGSYFVILTDRRKIKQLPFGVFTARREHNEKFLINIWTKNKISRSFNCEEARERIRNFRFDFPRRHKAFSEMS